MTRYGKTFKEYKKLRNLLAHELGKPWQSYTCRKGEKEMLKLGRMREN